MCVPQDCCGQCSHPHSEPQMLFLPPVNLHCWLLGLSQITRTSLLPLRLDACEAFVCLQVWSCFLQSCGIPVTKPCWPSEPDFLGAFSPDAETRRPEPTSVGELFWYKQFPACGLSTWYVWGGLFVFGYRAIAFWQVPAIPAFVVAADGCSAFSVILVFL